MTDITTAAPLQGARASDDGLTPAGLQSRARLGRRRLATLARNLALMAGLTAGIVGVFGEGGWSTTDLIILAAFLVGAPWSVMGVVNAGLGLWLLHARRDGLAAAAPHLDASDASAVRERVAVAMTVRNEPPEPSLRRLAEVRRSLDATGQGAMFELFVLSDTTDPAVAEAEERLFAAMRPALGGERAHYRRRAVNTGYKAGNVRDFLLNEGRGFPLYVPLDSDSLMSGEAIVDLVRTMQRHPGIAILQSLAVGSPSASPFARLFQFGMRHGMRAFTLGAAWWQGDCGPYWGHNAAIRTAAFRRHARLPVLAGGPPLGGHIMSHDQVEAALVRRAGWEVRVVPTEGESYEENPPTVLEALRRELRWCQGNNQYWPLLAMRGLPAVSRLQLLSAVMMYMGAPAWMLMTVAALAKLFVGEPGDMDLALGMAMFFVMITVSLVPKIAGMIDVALTPGAVARWGGRARFAAGCLAETLFSVLLAPVMAVHVTIFLVGLLFGRSIKWGGQKREAHGIAWADAVRSFWPQTLFGLAIATAILTMSSPWLLLWAAPLVGGLPLAIPFAVATASPAFGRALARVGLCAVPDEIAPCESLTRVAEPAGAVARAA
ncbi:MAG: glucans biosynthesis glucosyltransferase MdoH [Paracoccaceae bacterium]